MTDTSTYPLPPGASLHALPTRWNAWVARYINRRHQRRRQRLTQRQLAAMDQRLLDDIGLAETERFVGDYKPYREW